MSTYSAGFLKVGTLTATGTSAVLNTGTATVTNLTSTGTINTTNLNLSALNNLGVAGTLTATNVVATNVSAPKPNIVILTVDDLPFNIIGCYGGAKLTAADIPTDSSRFGFKAGDTIIATPNIDALAAGGLKFTNMFNQATCSPTRATMQTGMYPSDVGSMDVRVISQLSFSEPISDTNQRSYEGNLLKECNTLGELAKAGGYATFFGGKWHLGDMVAGNFHIDKNGTKIQNFSEFPTARGYDYWDAGYIGGTTNVLNPMKTNASSGSRYNELDYVRDPSSGIGPGRVPTNTSKWNRYITPTRTTATTNNEPFGPAVPIFNPVTDVNYFHTGANFPYIPQTVGTAGNMDGSGFMYHHTDDLVYSVMDRLSKRADKTVPFFACMNYSAVHDPVQDTPFYIKKFWTNYPADPTYETCVFMNIGWDTYRKRILTAQLANGVVLPGVPLPARSDFVMNWSDLTYADKQFNAKSMAIIAAMTVHIDVSVGNFVNYLKTEGVFNNTMIMFMSDNGGAGNFSEQPFSSGKISDWGPSIYDASTNPTGYQEGDEDSNLLPGWAWAEAMDYPLRLLKAAPEKGGCQTPFVLSWPNGVPVSRNGSDVSQYCWLEDIFPTMFELCKPIQDVVDSSNQTKFNIKQKRCVYNTQNAGPPNNPNVVNSAYINSVATLPPLKGSSFLPIVKGESPNVQIYRANPEVSDLCSGCASSVTWGNWQIIIAWGAKKYTNLNEPSGVWRLYNTITDPYQTTDLASQYPEKYNEMKGYYNNFVLQQQQNNSANAYIYKLAPYVSTYGYKLSNMIDVYFRNQMVLDGSNSFLPDAVMPSTGWLFKGNPEQKQASPTGALAHKTGIEKLIPQSYILNTLKSTPTEHGTTFTQDASGMYAGNTVVNGKLSDPHFESTMLLTNSGFYNICIGWDGSFNREFPTLPMLTYFYDDAIRIVVYANSRSGFFDSSGQSGGSGIDETYNAFAGITDSSNFNYDPLAATDASGIPFGRSRFVLDLPYAEMNDRSESGYYLGDWSGNPYDYNNGFQYDSSGIGFSLDSSGLRVKCDASGNMSEFPPKILKRVIRLITGSSLLVDINNKLSKNYYLTNSQKCSSNMGLSIRFRTDPSGNLDINTSLNYAGLQDQAWGHLPNPLPLSLGGGFLYYPNNSRTTNAIQLKNPEKNPYATVNRIQQFKDTSGSPITFNGKINYLTYKTDRENPPTYSNALLNVGNATEGLWSGVYGTPHSSYFNNNSGAGAGACTGFQINRNQTHKYFAGDYLQQPYATGKAGPLAAFYGTALAYVNPQVGKGVF